MPSHAANLERVSERIAAANQVFCEGRRGSTFHADELRAHVRAACGPVAPGSPDRVLRDLRQRGLIAYELVSRRDSLYRLLPDRPVRVVDDGGQAAWRFA
jgi:hypothetical protein